MPNPKLTEIAIVLDRSGSMASIKEAMEKGYNEFMAKQREIPDPCDVSLYQFDDVFETVYEEKPLAEVPPLALAPRNMTALLDALGKSINAIGARLATRREDKRPGKVVVMVITDGLENSSKEFSRQQVADLIRHQTDKYNWQFAFLGANMDSFAEAKSMNINQQAVANFVPNASGVNNAYSVSGAAVMSYRSSTRADASLSFKKDDEKESTAGSVNQTP